MEIKNVTIVARGTKGQVSRGIFDPSGKCIGGDAFVANMDVLNVTIVVRGTKGEISKAIFDPTGCIGGDASLETYLPPAPAEPTSSKAPTPIASDEAATPIASDEAPTPESASR